MAKNKSSEQWEIRLAENTSAEHGRYARASGAGVSDMASKWDSLLESGDLDETLRHLSPPIARELYAKGFSHVDDWSTGGGHPDRSGINTFVHIVRSPLDKERLSRKARQEMHENSGTKWCGDMKKGTKPQWREKIVSLLGDGKLRTFNAIVLEASGMEYTADVAHGKAPDSVLWELVSERKIEHTMSTPILFRIVR